VFIKEFQTGAYLQFRKGRGASRDAEGIVGETPKVSREWGVGIFFLEMLYILVHFYALLNKI